MGGKQRNRYNAVPVYPVELRHWEQANELMPDPDYERKVDELMAIMQGKRIVGKGQLGSIVDMGD